MPRLVVGTWVNRMAAAAGRIVGLMAHKVRGQWGVRKGIHFSLSIAVFNAEVEAELHCTLFVSVFCWLFEGSRYQRSPFDWSVLGDTAQADTGCTRTFKLSRHGCGATAKKITRSMCLDAW